MADDVGGASRPVRQAHGWWEQRHLGRQAMDALTVSITGGVVRGQGRDRIAPFTLDGTIDQRGAVAILKRYQAGHSVHYVGMYDGEGVLSGRWHLTGGEGRWLIAIRGGDEAEIDLDAIEAIEPGPRD
ncbi:MAG: hypothetical protein ACOYK7_16945 [Pirellulales bacterium]|jgi:hypothetical protein